MPVTEVSVPAALPTSDPVILNLHGRVEALEKAEYRRDTEVALIKKDLEYIRQGQDRTNAGVNKLFWLVIAGMVAAFVNFVINGGLSVTP